MKILNINSYYYSSTVHKQLQDALLSKGNIDSATYVPVAKGYQAREECRDIEEKNIKRVECYNYFDRYVFHLKHYKIFLNIEEHYHLYDFDCLHAHSLFSNGYIAMNIKGKYGIPYIVAMRDTDINTFFKHMVHLRYLGIKILENANKIIFLSEPYKDYLISKYIPNDLKKNICDKSLVIPNGIDEFWLENKGSIKQLNNKDSIKLVYVGAINKRKNLISTINAIEILRNNGMEITYTIVGKAADKALFNRIKNLPYVNYIKPVSKDKLLKIYRDHDIFVMPSITETFGLVYPEAMSQGLPVIYTKGQGFDGQFADGEVGYAVDCFDINEIAKKIVAIIENYEVISKRCVEYSDKFHWEDIVGQYCEIYNLYPQY